MTALLSLTTGCASSTPPVSDAALFCDVMVERFRYTQDEIDARTAAGFTKNLAREYRLNLSWDRECEEVAAPE